jgi:hypothetical protein
MIRSLVDRAVRRLHPAKTREDIKADVRAKHDEIGMRMAKRYVRGNINIKRGKVILRKEA